MKIKEVDYKSNPYTSARVSAMKSLLLKKNDYDKLMKLGPKEIIKFLQEGVYQDEINQLSVKYSGNELIDHALNMHLGKIFQKLRIISDSNIKFLIDQYLRRYDYWNLKVLLRARQSNVADVSDMFLPGGSLRLEKLEQLSTLTSVKDILTVSGIINMDKIKDALQLYDNTHNLIYLENALDYLYLTDAIKFSKKIPSEGKLFKQFFRYEIDVHNIELTLKRISYKLDKSFVNKYIIYGGRIISEKLDNMKGAETIQQVKIELAGSMYDKVFAKGDSLMLYEVQLERILLEKSLLMFHKHPLSVDVVLGYMFAKEIESRNIRAIFKSRLLELDESYVKPRIIISKR